MATGTASAPRPDLATPVDGRSARRERGRQAVIEAVVELLLEGHAPPSTAQITERAGVSEATLFRYFETIGDLQFAASQRFLAGHGHLFEVPRTGQGELSARIDRFVAARCQLWDAIAPIVRLGRARAFDHPGMAELLRTARQGQARQVAAHFEPELAALPRARRDDLVALITSITSFEAWDLQCRDLDRTPAQVRRSWRAAVTAVLEVR